MDTDSLPAFFPEARMWREAYGRLDEMNETPQNNLKCAADDAFRAACEAIQRYSGFVTDPSDHAEAMVGLLLRFIVASNPGAAGDIPTVEGLAAYKAAKEPPKGYSVFPTPAGRYAYERSDGNGAGVGYHTVREAVLAAHAHNDRSKAGPKLSAEIKAKLPAKVVVGPYQMSLSATSDPSDPPRGEWVECFVTSPDGRHSNSLTLLLDLGEFDEGPKIGRASLAQIEATARRYGWEG